MNIDRVSSLPPEMTKEQKMKALQDERCDLLKRIEEIKAALQRLMLAAV